MNTDPDLNVGRTMVIVVALALGFNVIAFAINQNVFETAFCGVLFGILVAALTELPR